MKTMIMLSCAAMMLRAKDDEGGGGTMTEAAFQQKVLGTQKSTEAKVTDLTANFDNLQKETKSAFEDLTKLKNQGADVETLQKSLSRVELQLSREKRLAHGDPVQRISGDEEMRASLNAVVRFFSGQNGDLRAQASKILGKAIGEDSSPGSTLLVPQLMNEIYNTLAQYGAWNTLGVRRLGTKITTMPIQTARAQAGWLTTEGSAIADDATKAGTSVNLQVFPIAVLLNISRQLLEDAEFDITANIMDDFVEAFNYVLDYTAFQGNGTVDFNNGGQTGLFNFGAAATAKATHTTMETLTLEDWMAPLLGVDPVVLSRPARWWMHPFMLVRSLSTKDLNGRPIFLTALEAPASNAVGSILSYPITPVLTGPFANVAGSKVAAFGDPQGYTVGVRTDFQVEASDHYRWANLQRSFRGVGRAGCIGRRQQAFTVLTTAAS